MRTAAAALIIIFIAITCHSGPVGGNLFFNLSQTQLNEEKIASLRDEFERISQSSSSIGGGCECDSNANHCDLECCCDRDCSELQRYSFHRCQWRSVASNDHHGSHCQPNAIWNTEKLDLSRSTLLTCFAKDNSQQKSHRLFGSRKTITDQSQLMLIKAKHESKWMLTDTVNEDEPTQIGNISSGMVEYKSGSKMISFKADYNSANATIFTSDYWKLPAALMSTDNRCNFHRQVQFMYDFASECVQTFHGADLANECAHSKDWNIENYYKSFLFTNFTEDSNVIVRTAATKHRGSLRFDFQRNRCLNVVDRIAYTVFHDGVFGVRKVLLQVQQIDLPGELKLGFFMQSFTVRFRWSEENQTEIHRKGGYSLEDPLLFSTLTNGTRQSLSPGLIGTFSLGQCNSNNKQLADNRIVFGVNEFRVCQLKQRIAADLRNKICPTVAHHIEHFLRYDFGNLFVAAYANATLDRNQSWIPVFNLDSEVNSTAGPDCKIITGISYEIYFVKIGNEAQYSYKVIGAGFRHQTHRIRPVCQQQSCEVFLDLDLQTAVTFVDVTEPLRPDYAPPPSIKLELPNDFFYPFLIYNSAGTVQLAYCLATLVIIIITTLHC